MDIMLIIITFVMAIYIIWLETRVTRLEVSKYEEAEEFFERNLKEILLTDEHGNTKILRFSRKSCLKAIETGLKFVDDEGDQYKYKDGEWAKRSE